MSARPPNVWTCSAGLGRVLVEQIQQGFPLGADERPRFDLSQWTILVPTRRAARLLEKTLFEAETGKGGRKALVLPRIRPIGDVDEDLLLTEGSGAGLKPAISQIGQLFLMLQLVDGWVAKNPHLPLARDVNESRGQALGLAQSLADLVNQLETEEVALDFAGHFDNLELPEHRQAVLSLLHLVQEELPRRLAADGLTGPAALRNALISAEAERITAGHHHGPIIAAGSTGTNPATRRLLKAIANHEHGAVILPGLDTTLDDASWDLVAENHPQHAMKLLLAELAVTWRDVRELTTVTPRTRLLREVVRPAASTEKWHDGEILKHISLDEARKGLRLIEAPDRHMEARCIAMLLRKALATPGRRAALVTPDRNLGQQVTEELKRWQVGIDDSGGEPLIRFGKAQLCALVMACVEDEFSPASLVALLAHPDLTLGIENARHHAALFEIACLRRDLVPRSAPEFPRLVEQVKQETAADRHAHPILSALDAGGWDRLLAFATRFAAALSLLHEDAVAPLETHVAVLLTVLDALAPADDGGDATGRSFATVMEGLRASSFHHPVTNLHRAIASITWALRQEKIRRLPRDDVNLAIYGLAEARMIEADLVVLGGLNESVWPAAVDPGPWFNRAMRKEMKLAQPERDIGITAHDFVQNAAHPNVVLTWSKRLGTTPVTPSRWVLRLRALLSAQGVGSDSHLDNHVLHWAQALDAPDAMVSLPMPRPAPPVALRPTTMSVTTIERLIRDPYAIYAQKILKLEPLVPIGGGVEPRLRGSLFHGALSRWLQPSEAASLERLLQTGNEVFAPYRAEPEVRHFWWPRFLRMARALVVEHAELCTDVRAHLVEVSGYHRFTVAGVEHVLTARADRIDVTQNGKVRFIDYKSGAAPTFKQVESGLNPQLTLEAAILLKGEYQQGLPVVVDDLIYIRVGGGRPPVEITRASGKMEPQAVAGRHLDGLKSLLASYQDEIQPYVPRAALFREQDPSDYDHLSRYAEWSRGGASRGRS